MLKKVFSLNNAKPFAIDSLLKDLACRLKQPIPKDLPLDDPLQFIRLVRKNKMIKRDLIAVCERYQPEVRGLATQIKNSDWASPMFRWKNPDAEFSYANDLAFVAFAVGLISETEFNNATLAFDIYRNFTPEGGSRTYTYRENNVEKEVTFEPLNGAVTLNYLFDEGGQLTPFGHKYLSNVLKSEEGFRQKNVSLEQLSELIRKSNPRACVFSVSFSDIEEFNASKDRVSWKNIHTYAASNGMMVKSLVEKYVFDIPDQSVADGCNLATIPLEMNDVYRAFKPKVMLGTMSPLTMKTMQLQQQPLRPVSTLDERVKTNLVKPHGKFGEEVFTRLHDSLHHVRQATNTPWAAVEFLNWTLDLILKYTFPSISDSEREIKDDLLVKAIDIKLGYFIDDNNPIDYAVKYVLRLLKDLDRPGGRGTISRRPTSKVNHFIHNYFYTALDQYCRFCEKSLGRLSDNDQHRLTKEASEQGARYRGYRIASILKAIITKNKLETNVDVRRIYCNSAAPRIEVLIRMIAFDVNTKGFSLENFEPEFSELNERAEALMGKDSEGENLILKYIESACGENRTLVDYFGQRVFVGG